MALKKKQLEEAGLPSTTPQGGNKSAPPPAKNAKTKDSSSVGGIKKQEPTLNMLNASDGEMEPLTQRLDLDHTETVSS